MKKRAIIVLGILVLLAVLALSIPAFAASPMISFDNVSQGDMLTIGVGDSLDFNVTVTSDTKFVNALLISDQYYPGRGIFLGGVDIVSQDNSANLQLTATGKNSTADLEAAAGCPVGYAPVGLVAAVRYLGGLVVSDQIDFCIEVVP